MASGTCLLILLLGVFQGQDGWSDLLQRFHQGGGELLDVEFIVNDSGGYFNF